METGKHEYFTGKTEYVIVDTLFPMRRFLKDTEFFTGMVTEVDAQSLEEYLDTVLDRVLDCVSHPEQVHSRLWDYCHELRDHGQITDTEEETKKLAEGVLVLGETLADQLKMLGAYENKELGYYYSGRIGHADLILSRI